MANKTWFQISVVSVDGEDKEEVMSGGTEVFHPDAFKAIAKSCITELAHGGKLIDEVSRKLVIEFEFVSYDKDRREFVELAEPVKDVLTELRERCFNFAFEYPTVVHCEINGTKSFGDKAKVNCIFSDGSSKVVFDFYNDELSFRQNEFLGLTETQCHELFTKKDIAYLRS
jgi:hypothetical protein